MRGSGCAPPRAPAFARFPGRRPSAVADRSFAPSDEWFRREVERERIAGGGTRLRFPLVFEEQGLGALELRVDGGRAEGAGE